jgi:hypothetical protein
MNDELKFGGLSVSGIPSTQSTKSTSSTEPAQTTKGCLGNMTGQPLVVAE